MTKPVISPEAAHDLEEIGDYIAFRLKNRIAARNVVRGIRKAISSLQELPERGTPVHAVPSEPMYRSLQSGNYLIFYYVSGRTAYVDRILYAHRDSLAILFGIDAETSEEHDEK